jgi:hypothetical protein
MNQIAEISREDNAARQEALADCTPGQLADGRYRDALAALVEDAISNQRLEMLVDRLTSTLGSIGLNCGPRVTGDILGRLGHHLIQADARRRAANEAEQAKKEGRAPH